MVHNSQYCCSSNVCHSSLWKAFHVIVYNNPFLFPSLPREGSEIFDFCNYYITVMQADHSGEMERRDGRRKRSRKREKERKTVLYCSLWAHFLPILHIVAAIVGVCSFFGPYSYVRGTPISPNWRLHSFQKVWGSKLSEFKFARAPIRPNLKKISILMYFEYIESTKMLFLTQIY